MSIGIEFGDALPINPRYFTVGTLKAIFEFKRVVTLDELLPLGNDPIAIVGVQSLLPCVSDSGSWCESADLKVAIVDIGA